MGEFPVYWTCPERWTAAYGGLSRPMTPSSQKLEGSDGFHGLRRGLVADGAVGTLRIVLVSERLAFYLGVGQ